MGRMKDAILVALIVIAIFLAGRGAYEIGQLEKRLADYDHVSQDAACAWHKDLACPPPLPVRRKP
jgi:hypothetical protein